jgi:hypothetical protein
MTPLIQLLSSTRSGCCCYFGSLAHPSHDRKNTWSVQEMFFYELNLGKLNEMIFFKKLIG